MTLAMESPTTSLRESVSYRAGSPQPGRNKIDVAKIRRQVKNIRAQLDIIETELREL
jgi:hypothetical protein